MRSLAMKLADSTVDISVIVLGTDYFGTRVPEKDVFSLLDIYMDAGGNCLDTARIYTAHIPGGYGASERTLGSWLKARNNRSKVIISTKGGHPDPERMLIGRLSRKEIEKDLDESLRALGVDYVDIYWLHRDDESRPVEDIMETLSILTASGKIRAIGCSNWKSARIEEANKLALEAGYPSFIASQIQWSLAESTPEGWGDPTLVCMNEFEYGWYEKNHFPVFAYSAQSKGFFSRAASMGLEYINQKALSRFSTPVNIERLERVKQYAGQNNLTVSAVTLGYITCNRVPGVAIVGPKNEEQLRDTLTAADVDIPQADADWLYGG
jgi:aryl-alcohol dehydrogenase-like predicted oxidoreductase